MTPAAEEEVKLRAEVHAFAEQQVAPTAAARTREQRWEPELFTKLATAKLLGAAVPSASGGRGWGSAELIAALSVLGEVGGDVGVALAWAIHSVVGVGIVKAFGSPAQKAALLPKVTRGEVIFGLSIHELEGGGHAGQAGLQATRAPDGWILKGTKAAVVNGPDASHVLVTALSDVNDAKAPRFTAFIIDTKLKGITWGARTAAPLPTCTASDLSFDGCQVPFDAVLGSENAAAQQVLPLLLAIERSLLLAPWLGRLQTVLKLCTEHCRQGALLGKPLGNYQAVRRRLVEMRRYLEQVWGLIDLAAGHLDAGSPQNTQDAAIAKLFMVEGIADFVSDATSIFGHEPHDVVQRAWREAPVLEALGGGRDLLYSVIGGSMLHTG